MSVPGVYILGLRQGRRVDRQTVASATGIGVDRQRDIEEGYVAPTPVERDAYARHFGFASLDEFDENWRTKMVQLTKGESTGRIPVINLAPAGEPRSYEEAYPNSGLGYAYIDPPPGISGANLFAFVIFGDSMEPDYPDGDYAICRPASPNEIIDGSPVFVRFGAAREHGCTFKKCYQAGPLHVELQPINPRCRSQIVLKEDIDRMAVVIAVVRRKRENEVRAGAREEIFFDEPGA
jgi:SOS-response transcriptional repressor LexA